MRYSVRDPLRTTGLVVLLGVIMTILDTTIMNVAVTPLAREFHTTTATMQWVITGYLLALSTAIPLTGWAMGRFGTKTVWLASLVLFAGGSALSAAAWSVPALIVCRALQGLGGGLLMPAGQAMIARAAGQDRLGRAMAMISVPAMLAPVLGPVVGGVILDSLDWRWLFLLNLPVCAAALVAAALLLPPEPAQAGRAGAARPDVTGVAGPAGAARLDVLGLALLSPGLAALVLGLSEVGNGSPAGPPVLCAGLALVAVFAVRAVRRPGGLLDLRLFRDRTFTRAVLALVCYSAALFGTTVLVPLHSQLAAGGTALDAGLLLAPMGVGAAITMPIAGRLTDHGGPRGVASAGVVVAAAGMLAFVLFGGYVPMFVLGLGHGLVAPSVAAAAFRTLDRADLPAAATLNTISVRLASSFGVALLAVLLQVFTRAGVPRPFDYAFGCAIALTAVSLLPIALIGSKAWRASSSAPA